MSVDNWLGLLAGIALTVYLFLSPSPAGEVLMNSALAGWLQVALLEAALAACYVPLGNYMAKIFTTDRHWRVERGVYKVIGVDPQADQKWSAYVRSMLSFSVISVLFLYGIARLQHYLLLNVRSPVARPGEGRPHSHQPHRAHPHQWSASGLRAGPSSDR